MANGRIIVTNESATGRNNQFKDTKTGKTLSRAQVVKAIEEGNLPNYHNRLINGIKTPVSNPDRTKDNNLG